MTKRIEEYVKPNNVEEYVSRLCPDLNRRNQRLAYRRCAGGPFARR
jgi:hypothetical protein